jgi:hypothetical protein
MEAALRSNPQDPDLDRDGLMEGVESRLGSDPLEADSNGDGLGDAADNVVFPRCSRRTLAVASG